MALQVWEISNLALSSIYIYLYTDKKQRNIYIYICMCACVPIRIGTFCWHCNKTLRSFLLSISIIITVLALLSCMIRWRWFLDVRSFWTWRTFVTPFFLKMRQMLSRTKIVVVIISLSLTKQNETTSLRNIASTNSSITMLFSYLYHHL